MRNRSTLAFLLVGALAANAQTLSNVVITPPNPTECQLLTFNFIGSMPQNAQFTGFLPSFGPDSLSIALSAAGGGGGNAGFNQELAGLGPFAPGTYVVYVTFSLNGNLVGTFTDELTIGPGSNPDAGEYGQLDDVCNGDPAVPLISLLGGTPDPGGVWIDPEGQVVTDGMFVPGQSPGGFYTYNFDVQEPCIDASSLVLISYAATSGNAGLNGTIQTCATSGAPFDLFALLGGTPDAGGTWSFGGAPHPSTFTPVVDPCGIYTYTVPAQGTCPPATATVTVQCVNPPNAGTVNLDTLFLCFDDSSQVLQNIVIGEQNTGFWIGPSGFGVGVFNAAINCAINGSGAYGYVVVGTVCPNDTSFVNVELVGPPCDIGVAEVEGNVARFEILPNPADDQVTIEVELARAAGGQVLELLDVDGRVVRSQGLNFNGLLSRQTISVVDLPRGAYLVRVMSREGRAVRRLMLR